MECLSLSSLSQPSLKMEDSQSQKVVYEKLVDIGCCKTCCLRFLGETTIEPYKNVSESLRKRTQDEGTDDDGEKSTATKLQRPNPCITCLGLLQKPTCDEIIEKVLEEIRCKDYDSDTFNVAITLPVIFQLRAHSLWLFLEETFPSYTHSAFPIGCVTVGVKDVWKWLFAPYIENQTGKKFYVESDLFIGITITYPDNGNECSCLFDMLPDLFNKKRSRGKKNNEIFSRKGVEQAFKLIQKSLFLKHFPVPPKVPVKSVSCDAVNLQHNAIFIAGRYNKWSRQLPQTPWLIGGERKMESSVQEIICEPLEKETGCEGSKFGASGREDVDVRTLGRGRPFSVELLNPRHIKLSKKTMWALQTIINKNGKGKVSVRDLQLSTKESLVHLKTGEEKKTKEYTAFCVLFGPFPPSLEELSKKGPIELSQKTPIRVLHRRPVATRTKTVHWLEIEKMSEGCNSKDPSYFTMRLSTQAGTYIKEFIHGDFGRTKPSLGELIGNIDVDILALDVQEISLDWPPPIKCDNI